MNFDIEEKPNIKKKPKKKKVDKVMVLLSIFFFTLSGFLFLIHYIDVTTPMTYIKEEKNTQNDKTIKIINEKSNDRPIAVMLDNNIGKIKHAGLQESYINYEIIVEGGLTRIMAIYKDTDTTLIGPVRSARNYFLDYALEYDAIYTHFGWSPSAKDDISTLNVDNINGITDTTPFARDKNIQAPHNVFTSITKIKNYATSKNYKTKTSNWKNINYSKEEIYLDKKAKDISLEDNYVKSANKISIDYSNLENRTYTYDSENKYYLRSQNGNAHIDRITNEQLNFKNIIIQKVNNRSIDNEDRQRLDTVGIGEGYYITNGYYLPIIWKKESRTQKTQYMFQNGADLVLNDGNTFIQIVPLNSNIIIK